MKALTFFYCMSYIVTEDSVLEVVSALSEEKHIHMNLLSCARVKIVQTLY